MKIDNENKLIFISDELSLEDLAKSIEDIRKQQSFDNYEIVIYGTEENRCVGREL